MKFFGQITSITILITPIFAFAMIFGAVVLEEFQNLVVGKK